MIVSKFGGTSVGSAENIKKVIQIICKKEKNSAVVVSALGGVTNLLIEASELALANDPAFNDLLEKIEARHFVAIECFLKHENHTLG